VHGALRSQKRFFLRAKRGLCNDGRSALKSKGTVEKLCYYKFSFFIEIKFVSLVRIITDSLTYTWMYRVE